ncbi:HNH endonuclease [Arthrobacter phage Emotion]|uniref:HNH endonuclease n=1 Tax=Arthrobacter phage Emotion TaxID=3038361 RepID=A0AA49ET38_9CAUD|nr:HNH endonuclease [Arthrobacter phage Emotion]
MSRSTEDLIRHVAAKYDDGNGEGERLADAALRRLEWRKERGGRVCPKCGETKPVSEFGVDARKPDGLDPRCKACEASRKRESQDEGV